MAISVDQFAQRVADSAVLSAEDIQEFLKALPADRRPKDGEQFAREMVRQKKLTAFQAQQIYTGHGKSLTLGKYQIIDKLGQGGMGMVLKAEHRRMHRIVALKVLAPAAIKSPDSVKRFYREVEAAAKLNHPHIVTAYDADEASGAHFLVMEYVEGMDLASLVKKHGPLSPNKAAHCLLQAARGLEYAHQHGVVHRDIKPHNLLVDREGVVKILDMGLARIQTAGIEQAELTNTGQIMGTVDYMAPEQAINTKLADQRSDVYGLGMTFWYLLTGRPAYEGETVVEKLMAHQSRPVPSLLEARPEVPVALDLVFQRMVAKRAEDRYPSMSAVIAALEAVRGGAGTDSSSSVGVAPGEWDMLRKGQPGSDTPSSSGAIQAAMAPLAESSAFEQTVALPTSEADTNRLTANLLPQPLPDGSGSGHLPPFSNSGSQPNLFTEPAPVINPVSTGSSSHVGQKSHVAAPVVTPLVTPHAKTKTGRPGVGASSGGRAWWRNRGLILGMAVGAVALLLVVALLVWNGGGDGPPENAENSSGEGDFALANVAPNKDSTDKSGDKSADGTAVAPDSSAASNVQPASAGPGPFDSLTSPDWEWTAPENAGPQFNGPGEDSAPAISADGLCLVFASSRSGGGDLFECQRAGITKQFGNAVPLRTVNTNSAEESPFLSGDGLTMLFASARLDAGAQGGKDLYVSHRRSRSAPWEPPVNLGDQVNTAQNEQSPCLTPDGLSLLFASNRPGGQGGLDLWISHRAAEDQPFGAPENLGTVINSNQHERDPEVLSDNRSILFVRGNEKQPGSVFMTFLVDDDNLATQPLPMPGATGATGLSLTSDGRTAYYSANEEGGFGDLDIYRLYRVAHSPSRPPRANAPFDSQQARFHQDAWAQHLGLSVEFTSSTGINFVLVPPGEFLMGTSAPQAAAVASSFSIAVAAMENESPQHRVVITRPLLVSVTEVTIGQYRKYAVAGAQSLPDGTSPPPINNQWSNPGYPITDDLPVTQVNWDDAVAYCNWLNRQEGLGSPYHQDGNGQWQVNPYANGYRLLTEAEWEFVCRAGTTTACWSSVDPGRLDDFVWYRDNSATKAPHLVAQRPPNPFGLCDMDGNVREWCQDVMDPLSFRFSTIDDPLWFQPGSLPRIVRGGSFALGKEATRCAARATSSPDVRTNDLGFRIARQLDPR